MNWIGRIIVTLALVAAAAGGGYWYGIHRGAAEAPDADDAAATTQPDDEAVKPVVQVTVAPLRKGRIEETITAYGSVVAESSDVRIISVPFETRIRKVLVTPGQHVTPDTPLLSADASPDTLVALQDAKNAYEAASQELTQVQQRFSDHLATNAELSAARQAANSAKLKLDSLIQRGVGSAQQPTAGVSGLLSKVDVQEGQIVPAGGALVEIAAGNRIEVKLGVEPSDAAHLKPGQPVRIKPVSNTTQPESIQGKIRVIGQRVDPATRLVDVRVPLPADTDLLLDQFVTGTMSRATTVGFLVPRQAVLPDGEGQYTLFSVQDSHAVKHTVRIGLQNDIEAQVISDDLHPGMPVVVAGNYTLDDGMDVEVQSPATQPSSEPSESAASPSAAATEAQP